MFTKIPFLAAILLLFVPAHGASYDAVVLKRLEKLLDVVSGSIQEKETRELETRGYSLAGGIGLGDALYVQFLSTDPSDPNGCTDCKFRVLVFDETRDKQVADEVLPYTDTYVAVDGVHADDLNVVHACRIGDDDSCDIFTCPAVSDGLSICKKDMDYCDEPSWACDIIAQHLLRRYLFHDLN